jgi:hypothetical protein
VTLHASRKRDGTEGRHVPLGDQVTRLADVKCDLGRRIALSDVTRIRLLNEGSLSGVIRSAERLRLLGLDKRLLAGNARTVDQTVVRAIAANALSLEIVVAHPSYLPATMMTSLLLEAYLGGATTS